MKTVSVWFASTVRGVVNEWISTAETKLQAIGIGFEYAKANNIRCPEWYCCAENQGLSSGIKILKQNTM